MASVYKSLSKNKKGKAPPRARDEDDHSDSDVEMDLEMLSDESDSESELDEEEESGDSEEVGGKSSESTGKQQGQNTTFLPKTRVLMLTSRGVTYRYENIFTLGESYSHVFALLLTGKLSRQRHLLSDLTALLPHTHKESKLDTKKSSGYNFLLNSLADLHSCNVVFFLEARKHGQDLYLWLSRPPNGPTIKFAVTNLHTTGELGTGFAGNCLKGGRGVVVFDPSFDDEVVMRKGNEWRGLVREMLRSVFSVPKRGVRGMKPFIDRVIGIYYVDGKIWVRVYEIRETETSGLKKPSEDGENEKEKNKNKKSSSKKTKNENNAAGPEISLVEIGPRFVLTPILIQEGSFGGPVIYENKEYVSPNQVRREIRMKKASRYTTRRTGQMDRNVKLSELGLNTESTKDKELDELDTRAVFA